jgi:hypothetical protein
MLPIVPLRDFGRRFFVLMSLIAVAFIGLATLDRGLDVEYWHFACAACLVAYNVLLPKQPGVDSKRGDEEPRAGRAVARWAAITCLIGGILCGGIGISVDALVIPGDLLPDDVLRVPSASGAILVAGALSSALLLGATLVAMVLGHWYLVSRKLPFTALRHLTLALAVALGVRVIVGVLGVWAQGEFWSEHIGALGATQFFLSDGVFLLSRVLFGIVVPAILVPLVWRCVRIESNQSATGILYVIVAFVVFGEILAKHFLVNMHVVI